MSLLPTQIIPASNPIGIVQEDGATVMIDKNWWLFLYNLYLNSNAGTADPESFLLTQSLMLPDPPGKSSGGFTNPMTTNGDMIYADDNSGDAARLGIGTAGQVLTVVGSDPEWQQTYSNEVVAFGSQIYAPFIAAYSLIRLVYFNGSYYALAYHPTSSTTKCGYVLKSSNLLNWSLVYSSLLYTCYDLKILNNNLVLLGLNAADNFIEWSSDGVTWTKTTTFAGSDYVKYAAYVNGTYVFFGDGITYFTATSLSGSFSSANTFSVPAGYGLVSGIIYYNSSYYFVMFSTTPTCAVGSATSLSGSITAGATFTGDIFSLSPAASFKVTQTGPNYVVDSSGNIGFFSIYSNGANGYSVLCTANLNNLSAGVSFPMLCLYNTIYTDSLNPNIAYSSSRGFWIVDGGGNMYSCSTLTGTWRSVPSAVQNYPDAAKNGVGMTPFGLCLNGSAVYVSGASCLNADLPTPIIYSL